MTGFKKYFIAAAFAFAASFCSAAQISFQIVQHDDSADSVTEQSYVIEDSLLTGFFENGYIVTNSEASVSKSKSEDSVLFKTGIGEADLGFSDYFVQIRLYYGKSADTRTAVAELQKIEWDAANTKNGSKIAADSIENLKIGNKEKDLKKVSSDLILEIYKAIKTKK